MGKWAAAFATQNDVRLPRGFTKTKPHYSVNAERKRRKAARVARRITRLNRK